jgi:hypothetical protein
MLRFPRPTHFPKRVISMPAQIGAAVIAGLVLGLASVVLSPKIILLILIGLFAAPLLILRLEIVLLVILVGYSTFVDVNVVPLIPIGVGSLNVFDAALLGCLGLILIRRVVEKRRIIVTDLSILLLIFYAFIILSTMLGIWQGTTNFKDAVTELRYTAYYLLFFVVFHLFQSKRQLKALLYGFFVLAFVVAIAMMVQYLVGNKFQLIYGRVEVFAQDGHAVEGVTRIIPAGRYLILVSFITLTCLMVTNVQRHLVVLVAWLVIGMGVLLTFNRNFWISSAIVLLVFFVIVNWHYRQRLIKLALMSVIAAGLVIGLIMTSPDSFIATTIGSVLERLTSIFDSNTYQAAYQVNSATSSLEFRRIETEYAVKRLWPIPVLGLGLGARYRPYVSQLDWGPYDGRGYIHNAHLWVILKGGFGSYITLLLMYWVFLTRGIRYWRRVPERWLGTVMLAFSLSSISLLLSAIVDPLLVDLSWTPIAGIMFGVNEYLVYSVKSAERAARLRALLAAAQTADQTS